MKTIKSTKAEAYPMICVYIIIFVSLLALIITYTSAVSKVNIMRENTKVVLDSFITENAVEIYQSIKQGNDYTEAIDEEEYRTAFVNFCTLEMRGDKLYSIDADGTEKYHLTIPTVSFREENELELIVNYTISVPLSFAGLSFTTASIPIEVSSNLTERF